MEYAPRVCHTCKARKKRCDKALPRCGYCTARDLACSYELHPEYRDQQHQNTYSRDVFLLSDPRFMPATTATLDEILNVHVYRIKLLTKVHVRDIDKRFFPNCYRWLPVLSPTLFNRALTSYEEQSSSPPLADFSLLLLALHLITWRQSDRVATNFSPESLYMTVRTLFGQVQAAICASTALVQAGLLIAAYDYACGRPHSAYILMGTCVRMALTLGLDKVGRNIDQNDSKAREQYMVWCALVVLER
jgi:Fungal specific transcription factor domain/Fungal Zn(2)-Cys(6) binuclear cluster domain